ncbi:MAG TPA: phosphoribosylformylglycinamidine synthase I [Candidatus Brocadiales bacterium]|nr:phosphoribosylformylglycinamidine synthase I [Candidatus Brocadiales bacterium]
MKKPEVLIIRAAGTNCDWETEYAFEKAGALVDRLHINRILEQKDIIHRYHIIAIPGGFSYGDDIAGGKVLANQLRFNLQEEIQRFISDGKLILGVCNGFQVLVKSGLLPGFNRGDSSLTLRMTEGGLRMTGNKKALNGVEQEATFTFNDSSKFEDRWVYLKLCSNKSVFIREGDVLYLPVANAEGKFVVKDDAVLQKLIASEQIIFKYTDNEGNPAGYPFNPNGSVENIAGVCDPTGRILGMMPHPERYAEPTQHPHWTREGLKEEGDGITIFRNAINFAKNNLL